MTPLSKGIATAVAVQAFLTGLSCVLFAPGLFEIDFGAPSADLLRGIAAAGVGLLVAYSVAIAAAERRLQEQASKDRGSDGVQARRRHEEWLGFATGTGLCGFAGIALVLGMAERQPNAAGLVDFLALWWAVGSLLILGLVVAALPLFSYEWRTTGVSPSDDD